LDIKDNFLPARYHPVFHRPAEPISMPVHWPVEVQPVKMSNVKTEYHVKRKENALCHLFNAGSWRWNEEFSGRKKELRNLH